MSDEASWSVWVEYAEEDFAAARSLMRRKTPLVRPACFHAQQCAEKYLKALLVFSNASFSKTHDLIKLNDLCAKSGILVEVDINLLDLLTGHAVRVRYPDDSLTKDDVRQAIATAKVVRDFSRRFLGVK